VTEAGDGAATEPPAGELEAVTGAPVVTGAEPVGVIVTTIQGMDELE